MYKRPFLKWAGNKFRLIETILKTLPKGNRLIEPFVGSGAVFLNAGFNSNIVSDSNKELIDLFNIIKTEGMGFIDYLDTFFKDEFNNSEKYYYYRRLYNESDDSRLKSALLVYLNRHCFNGLYRCNSRGEFNVPFGRFKEVRLPKKELLHFLLRSKVTEFHNYDFNKTLDLAKKGDVVYCDPPYSPLTKTSDFSKYTKDDFTEDNHIELRDKILEIRGRGVKILLSNHDTEFTRELYKDAKNIKSFRVRRYIAANVNSRKKVSELLALF